MKSIVVNETGNSDKLQLIDAEVPRISPKEILIKTQYAGVNFIDIYLRKGVNQVGQFPYTPGQEGSGIVEKVGSEVTDLQVGDPVAFPFPGSGSYAEYVAISPNQVVKVPDQLDLKIAGAGILQGLAAQFLTHSTFSIQEGHTVLIHAAAGGVGLLMVQMAKLLGAKVIGTVSTEEKAKQAKEAGADLTILYTQQDFEKEVQEWTEGKGVEAVYDSVGKDTFEKSLKVLKPRGVLALFGNASGVVPPFDLHRLNGLGSLYVTRPSLRHYADGKEALQQRTDIVFSYFQKGKIKVKIGKEYALSQAAKAHDDLESRSTTGKLVLCISD